MKLIFVTRATGLLVLTSVLGACGTTSTKNEGEKGRENDIDLIGEWQDDCRQIDWLGLRFHKEKLAFNVLGDYLRTITASSKEDCSSLDFTINVGGTIQALGDSTKVENSKNINFSVLSATLRPESDKSATYLNDVKYCGVSDWAREKSTDVTNLDCQGTKYQKGDVVFDIYSLSSDKKELTFGKESFWLDKSKASDRPSELNPKRHFKH